MKHGVRWLVITAKEQPMYKSLTIGLLAATTVAGISIAEEIKQRQTVMDETPIVAVPGCTSFLVYDVSRATVHAYKRERPCQGETPQKNERARQ